MGKQTVIASISGVSCGRCVKKIHTALQEKDSTASIEVNDDKTEICVHSSLSVDTVILTITALGYAAKLLNLSDELATVNREFAVTGVKCGGCVKKLTAALQALDSEAQVAVDIDKQQLRLTSVLSDKQVTALLSELDYLPTAVQSEVENSPAAIAQEQQTSETLKTDSTPTKIPQAHQQQTFSVSGMTCAACVNSVEKALKQLSGVTHASVNFASRTAQVSGDVSADSIILAVNHAGYQAQLIQDLEDAENQRQQQEQQAYQRKRLQSWVGIGAGLLLMGYGLLGGNMTVSAGVSQVVWGIVGLVCLAIMWFCGRHFYRGAWLMAKRHSSNMDTLVALGTASAWLYSMVVVCFPNAFEVHSRHVYFEAAVMILGLINFGQALELKTRGKTSQSIRRLLDLRAKTAQVIRNGKTLTVAIEQVKVGDAIRVRAGENIPVDGRVTDGHSRVNEAMLTGESLTIKKQVGDAVSAGTLNVEGSFVMQATQIGQETQLAQIIQMVSQAQNSKPPMSRLADQVVAVFVPVVLLIALVTAIVWWLLDANTSHILVTAVSVLIIACPCALGLATPISTMIGVGKAAENGGLIRNGDALQRAADIDTVVLDKTGTITQGKPTVIDSVISKQQEKSTLFSLVRAMEQGSTHPLAKALLEICQTQQTLPDLENLHSIDGLGMTATFSGQTLRLGNETLMQEAGIDYLQSDFAKTVTTWKENAYTLVFFAVDADLQAVFAISDKIREDAVSAIQQLHQQGINIVMLTGDHSQTAAAIAQQTGIYEWQAQCLPEDKLNYVKQLQAKGYRVGVVGDGINDAPALAIADVGFAMGGGADAAIESADIALLNPSLHGIANVIAISEATLTNIKQNLWGAFIYNALGIPLAAGVLYSWTGWLLSPMIAGLAMSLSSVTVVSNANRLRFWHKSH